MDPHRKVHVLADNPMSRKPPEATAVDSTFVEACRKARLEPRQKYPYPVTESHLIGWISTPLIRTPEHDYRRRQTDITKNFVFPTKVKDKKEEK